VQLSDYKISGKLGEKIIDFDNPALITLGHFLNGNVRSEQSLIRYLTNSRKLRNNWSELDTIVQEQFDGYWDSEVLEAFNVTGQWFTFGGSEDITVYINKANQYIYNKFLETETVVEMHLDEFIDILEQWQAIKNR